MASLAELWTASLPRPGSGSTSPTGMFALTAAVWVVLRRKLWRTQVALTHFFATSGWTSMACLYILHWEERIHSPQPTDVVVVKNPTLSWKDAPREWPHEVSAEWKGLISNKDCGQLLIVAGQRAVAGCLIEALDQALSLPESHLVRP